MLFDNRKAWVLLLCLGTFWTAAPGCRTQPNALPIAPSADEAADRLGRLSDLVFDVYLPPETCRDNPELQRLAHDVRTSLHQAAATEPALKQMLESLAANSGVGELTREQVQTVLPARHASKDSRVRCLALAVRSAYLGAIYASPLGDRIANLAPAVLVSPDLEAYLRAHQPKLPPTRLVYDPASHAIKATNGRIDYVIVGSGPAGSVLAHELRRGGKTVILVERGPFVVPGAIDTRTVDWLRESFNRRTTADGAILTYLANTVGGGTTVNVDLAFAPTLPCVQQRIESWRKAGRLCEGQLSPKAVAGAYDWVREKIGTRPVSPEEVNANNRILQDGAAALGIEARLYHLNTYAPGRSPSPVTDKRSAVSGLLLEAMTDANNPLTLIPDAEVQRVRFVDRVGEDRRGGTVRHAVGIEWVMRRPQTRPGVIADPAGLGIGPGETVTLDADRVILAAGAVGSPALLLRSGLTNPAIGRGLVLHPALPILGRFDRPIDALKGTPATVYIDQFLATRGYAFEAMAARPTHVAAMIPAPPTKVFGLIHDFRRLGGFGVMLVDESSPDNRIVLAADGTPEIHYQLTEADQARFREGLATAVRLMFKAGAKEVILPTFEDLGRGPGATLTDESMADEVARLKFLPGATLLTAAHLQSSAKMGRDPATSVVDCDHRVWGTDNLFVVDGSVFPTSVGANPMQSIYTLAKLFADGQNRE
jgi:choline dehydrogenase-like flavoprotein